MPRILGRDQANLFQNPDRPERDILQVSDRGGHHIQRPRRSTPIVLPDALQVFP